MDEYKKFYVEAQNFVSGARHRSVNCLLSVLSPMAMAVGDPEVNSHWRQVKGFRVGSVPNIIHLAGASISEAVLVTVL